MAKTKVSALEPLPTVSESAPTGKIVEPVKTKPTVEEEALPTVEPGQVGHFSRDFKRG
jgi:hypothetical protein